MYNYAGHLVEQIHDRSTSILFKMLCIIWNKVHMLLTTQQYEACILCLAPLLKILCRMVLPCSAIRDANRVEKEVLIWSTVYTELCAQWPVKHAVCSWIWLGCWCLHALVLREKSFLNGDSLKYGPIHLECSNFVLASLFASTSSLSVHSFAWSH